MSVEPPGPIMKFWINGFSPNAGKHKARLCLHVNILRTSEDLRYSDSCFSFGDFYNDGGQVQSQRREDWSRVIYVLICGKCLIWMYPKGAVKSSDPLQVLLGIIAVA